MEQGIVKRRHFTDEEIKLANSVDILQLARRYGYETEKAGRQSVHLIHSGGIHVFTDNNRFYCFADDSGIKKGGAIDFVMRQERISFPDAVAKLLGVENAEYIRRETASVQAKERGPLTLPDKAENFKRAYWYLVSQRGIDA